MSSSTCPACTRPQLTHAHASPEVAAAAVAVHGERLTVEVCPCGHLEVAAALTAAAHATAGEVLPIARHRPLRGETCRSCRQPLTMPARRTVRAVTLTPEGLPVTTLRFDLPLRRCPACGMDQVPHGARHDVTQALTALFAAAVDQISGRDRPAGS